MLLRDYEQMAKAHRIYPSEPPGPLNDPGENFSYLLFSLTSEVGELAGVMQRVIRDVITEGCRGKAILELGDVLWNVSELAGALGTSLEAVAEANLKKLEGRSLRGTLGGGGDTR